MIDGGNKLQVEFTIEDLASFKQPWKGTKIWQKVTTQPSGGNVTGTYNEEIRCMDGEMVNPFNQEYAGKLEPLPTDVGGVEQKASGQRLKQYGGSALAKCRRGF